MVALGVWEDHDEVKWLEDLRCSWEKFGWSSEMVEKLYTWLSGNEVKRMLRVCAWHEVKEVWMAETQERRWV